MKNINKYIVLGSACFLSIFASCNNFDDFNTNPDTTTEVSARLLCTDVILSVTKFGGRDAKAYISDNAFPKYVGYANEGQLGTQYNTIGGGSFASMTMLPNIDKMLAYAKGDAREESYKGIAKFARASMFYRLTMEMGDIPYSQTNGGADGRYHPAYDSQESVLTGILEELKEADQHFAKGTTFAGDPTPYNGDPAKWRRASNSLALKILMTLSSKQDNASLNIKARFAEVVDANYLLEASTGYLGLIYSSQNRHPLSGTSDQFTSRTILSSLLVDELKNLNDRRLFYFAEPSGAEITGGKLPSDKEAYVGVDVAMDYADMNTGHSANKYSQLNKRYLTEDACEPRMLLTYAEQQLILAEANVRGWISQEAAQTYYEQGIKSALANIMSTKAIYAHGMPIDQAYIDSYLSGSAAFAATEAEQLQQIWMQRYILNFMQYSQSSYFEYRRTGYPVFPINPATSMNENSRNGVPMRWLYPSSETDYNREMLSEALDRQYEGYDEINKLMWLLK
ncbi:hypothetical protein AwDysgo_16620 [Bacteroidales bacterium]|nr:hypothetical protein AwDysgo_16620 [Bacteroidales bacterium]